MITENLREEYEDRMKDLQLQFGKQLEQTKTEYETEMAKVKI